MNDIKLPACTQGDRGETRRMSMGGVSNLDAVASARCLLEKGTTVVVLPCEIDAEAETATIELGSAEDAWLPAAPSVGTWYGQIECTFADGSVLTWPTKEGTHGRFMMEVLKQIEPAA